jgi:hypothetical protein
MEQYSCSIHSLSSKEASHEIELVRRAAAREPDTRLFPDGSVRDRRRIAVPWS